jgi:hypothetical protein
MLLCNIYIIYVTIRSARVRTSMPGQYASRHRQLSVMLMFVTFAFVVLTLPSCIYFVFFRHRMSADQDLRINRYMVQICLSSIQFTAHAINFFLYCFSTKNFRSEFQDFVEELILHLSKCKLGRTPMINTSSVKVKSKYLTKKPYFYPESTVENQQTGEQYALKDMQTVLIEDE